MCFASGFCATKLRLKCQKCLFLPLTAPTLLLFRRDAADIMSQQHVGRLFSFRNTSSLDLFADVVMSSPGSFAGLGRAGSRFEAFFK